jgi:hypothetical protein
VSVVAEAARAPSYSPALQLRQAPSPARPSSWLPRPAPSARGAVPRRRPLRVELLLPCPAGRLLLGLDLRLLQLGRQSSAASLFVLLAPRIALFFRLRAAAPSFWCFGHPQRSGPPCRRGLSARPGHRRPRRGALIRHASLLLRGPAATITSSARRRECPNRKLPCFVVLVA